MSVKDTIAAIASAPGKGGVGIIRISGDAAPTIMRSLFGQTLEARKAELLPIKNAAGEQLDKGIIIYYPAPHSYTGEHVLEIQGHGGPVVLNLILTHVLSFGARMARAGEFTERAFLNDKMDLAQAEAVADLIESGSEQAARAAARSMEGVFSKNVQDILEKLIALRLYIEAALDFPEEEIDFLSDQKLHQKLEQLHITLQQVMQTAQQGRLLKEGMTLVILGQPNAGKSSLLNALVERDTAIVTDIPGTTRDVLREYIHLDGMPLHIIDTAGLRESEDAIEQEGVRRAREEVKKADRVLLLVDAQKGLTDEDQSILASLPANTPIDIVFNKQDLAKQKKIPADETAPALWISAKTGEGLQALKEHLKQSMGYQQNTEGLFSARQRHLDALARVETHTASAREQLTTGAGELAAEELRLGQEALGEITGEFHSDDLLGKIFSSFCIGK